MRSTTLRQRRYSLALVYAEEESFAGVKRVEAARLIAEGYLSGQAT